MVMLTSETLGICQERVSSDKHRQPCGLTVTRAFNETFAEQTVETCAVHARRYEHRTGWCEVPVIQRAVGQVIEFPVAVAADLAEWADHPSAPATSKDDNRVTKLLAELARHEQYRAADHDRDGCVRCRLLTYLDGAGGAPASRVRGLS